MTGRATHEGRGVRRAAAWTVAIAAALAVPLTAMQFSREVQWSAFDFLFAGALMGAVAVVYELAARRGSALYRAGAGVALAAALLLVWVCGAVGIVGAETDPANLVFLGVLATAFCGALLSRFRAAGLAWTFAATAAAQIAAAIVALLARWGADGPAWPWDIVGASAMFTAMWMLASALFRRAARAGR